MTTEKVREGRSGGNGKLLPSLHPHKVEDVLKEVLKVKPPEKGNRKKKGRLSGASNNDRE